jgi:PPOX class probable F420-dependent enzyme
MDLTADQRRFLAAARVGRLATADADGRPAAVPVCFALLDGSVVSPLDDKPAAGDPTDLRRVRDVESNPYATVVVDRYAEDWSRLAWVQLRGTAELLAPTETGHDRGIGALREKYEQYRDHDIDDRPLVWIDVGHALAWGNFEDPGSTAPGDGRPPDA